MPTSWGTRWRMGDPLTELLDTITELESDDERDDFPWCDAARWCPTEVAWDAPYDDTLPAFLDDGCVIITDPMRPWVVVEYQPPWWALD